jgi:hypothetical protein
VLPKFISLLDSWVSIPLKSGLFFWLGGLIAWLYHIINWIAVHHLFNNIQPLPTSLINPNWQPFWTWLHNMNSAHTALLLFFILFGMTLSNLVITSLTFPTLRFLEGYGWLWHPFRSHVIEWIDKRYHAPRTHEFNQLGNPAKLAAAKRTRYLELENQQIYLLPKVDRLPTRLGNTLRSFERRPAQKYGLDALVCWPPLWLLLPESVQKDLAHARESLDDAIQIWLWSFLLLLCWTGWAWWLGFCAVLLMLIAYSWALQAAKTYGKLLETAFDLYRPLLYQALRFPLPDDPTTEKQAGENLTAYLLRGVKDNVQFEMKKMKNEENT